jgi:RimJ/RimL family protein N-acetyltransferase
VLEPFQRRGLASEVVRLLVERAFSAPRVERVGAETFSDHLASLRVLEKNGFQRRREELGLVWLERDR